MKRMRNLLMAVALLLGVVLPLKAQHLTTNDIEIPVREYRPRPGWFIGMGGGFNVGFNGNSFKSREFSGLGAGTALDVYVGMMSRRNLLGFGLGVQGLTISDRYTEYGRHQYFYGHGDFYLKLANAFIPYAHAGVVYSQGFSPAGGIGLMTPIKITDNIHIVPNIKITAVRGAVLGDRAASAGMIASATLGIRFDIGKENRRKKAVKKVQELMPEPEPIHDTVTIVVRDTVTIKEKEVVMTQPVVPVQETIKKKEAQFNRDLSDAVLFDTGSYNLTFAAKRILNEVAQYIIETPGLRTLIEGHTDDVGGDDMNMRLSRNRAAAVVDYLVSCGVNPFMITSVGYGKTRPLVPNTSAENRRRNRRVEIHFSSSTDR